MSKKSTSKTTTQKGKKGGQANHIAAGAAGAVIGGALGAAAGVVMSDDKLRQKAGNAANDLKDYASTIIEEANETATDKVSAIPAKMSKKKKS